MDVRMCECIVCMKEKANKVKKSGIRPPNLKKKNIVKTISAAYSTKSTSLIFEFEDLQQKVFISWHYPFNFPLSLNVGQPVEGEGDKGELAKK
jgi:hypothetical protein